MAPCWGQPGALRFETFPSETHQLQVWEANAALATDRRRAQCGHRLLSPGGRSPGLSESFLSLSLHLTQESRGL